MAQNHSAALVVSALIIGSSIVAGSLLVKRAVDRTGGEVAELKAVIQSASGGAGAAPRARDSAGQRPDPGRRYAVNTKGAPRRGAADAKIAVVEFSDFQCPYCSTAVPTLAKIEKKYGSKVRIVFKHLPLLPMHSKAPAAHAAAEAAHRQGKFWAMHDKIFGDQANMSPERYREYARELGLDLAQFDRDVADESTRKRIDSDLAEAQRLGLSGTPAFFVNGRFVEGAVPFETFEKMIDEELGNA